MNVALTRARSSLFVLGDSAKLRSNQYWAKLVDDAQARGLLMRVSDFVSYVTLCNSLTAFFSQVDANTFNSMAASVPPTVQVAPPSSKSTTKPIVTPPAFMAPLQTPKAISAQALASKTSVGSTKAAVKRPSDDSRVAPPPEKKPKMMVEVEKPELADAVATANASRPPPSAPVNGATPAPPRPKAKASLFMPSKTNKVRVASVHCAVSVPRSCRLHFRATCSVLHQPLVEESQNDHPLLGNQHNLRLFFSFLYMLF